MMSETPIKKQALLIGINEYQALPRLKYARQDAEAVADSLKQNYCFSDNEVMLLTDNRPGLFKPIDKYFIQDHLEKLADQDIDLFIFGFWGHGLFRNGKRYLCPLNVKKDRAVQQGLPFDELQELLVKIHAKNTCMILDCCQTVHDRGEADTLTSADQAIMENAARDIVLRRKEQIPDFQSNVAILNSCKEGQSAYEWDARQHGLFTAHLLDAMKKRSASVMQIAGYISSNIEKTAMELGKEQTPFYKLEGDIVLPVETNSTPPSPGDVFISYRSHHIKLVEPILKELSKRGISYYIDREKLKSGDYASKLTDALAACKVLLLIWTQDANDSKYMPNEVSMAFDLGKEIIPYKIGNFDNYKQRKLILYLKGQHIIEDSHDTVVDLVDSIEQAMTGRAPKPTVDNLPPIPEPTPPHPLKSEESDPFTAFIEEEKRKKLKRIQDLLNESMESYKNQEFSKAISALDVVLKLEPNSVIAKELKTLCQSGLELQVAEEDCKHREAEEQKQREEENHDLSVPGIQAGERKSVTVNGVKFAFRWCPAGTFMMELPTSVKGRFDNEKHRQVTLTKGLWMMETQVTLGMFKAFVSDTGYESKGNTRYSWRNPGFIQDDNHPVTNVSWDDAVAFCKWLSIKTGQNITLPTEAQWEYSCRAGTTETYAGNLDEMAWYDLNSSRKTHPVGTKKPNAWGLYDMHGNVWEWCQDWYGEYSSGSVTDPTGPWTGSYRVLRGGSWDYDAQYCQSTRRYSYIPEGRSSDLGFRCVNSMTSPEH